MCHLKMLLGHFDLSELKHEISNSLLIHVKRPGTVQLVMPRSLFTPVHDNI